MSTKTETLSVIQPPVATGCCGGSVPATTTPGQTQIKEMVKDHYGRAVQSRGNGCCQNGDHNQSIPQLAGYSKEVLEALPMEAVSKSFGCGDPLAFAGVQPGQTVLDIGSGAGIDCFIAAQKVGPSGQVIGLDMTEAMIAKARENAAKGGYTNVEFRLGDAENIPLPDASVDWVISNCVINLSPDKARVFEEIHRVLKPGGRISISDIVAENLPDFVKQDSTSYCGCVGGAIPESEYLRRLSQAGLTEVAVDNRLEYSPEQIKGFVLGDESLSQKYGALLATNPALAEDLKIASLKVIGRKPATDDAIKVTTRPATRSDLPAIAELLTANNLPLNGFEHALPHATVAEVNRQVIGAVALEQYSNAALVRSLVVAKAWRARGIAMKLWQALQQHATVAGVRDLYLLTTSIPELAARAGFKPITREQVPEAVRASSEFSESRCAGAATMHLRLP